MPSSSARHHILQSVLSIAIGAACLARGQAAERYVFEMFGADQGLRNMIVTALCQDRDGFLWVGTENGLYRYDGHRFLHFSSSDGLPNDIVTGIHETPDGTLWVGTTKGLAWRIGIRFAASANETLRAITPTQAIATGPTGQLYLATGKGLARAALTADRKEVQLDILPPPAGTRPQRATSVWIEPQGAVWFGCGPSICRLEGGDVQVWGESAGVPSDGWQWLAKDSAGNLWARSRIRLLELPARTQQFQLINTADAGPLHFGYPSLVFDAKGAMLVPTDSGLSMLRDGVWNRIGHRQGLPGSIITAALRGAGGLFWVGTSSGLARWTGYGEWQSFTEMEGLASGTNLALLEDRAGVLWAGNGAGLSRGVFAGGSWRWAAVEDRTLTWVSNLARSQDGAIWLSTVEPQVVRFDPRTGRSQRFGRFDGPPYFLMIDSSDNLWVVRTNALFRGSARSPSSGFEQVRPPDSVATTVFTRAVQDSRGDLWFGSFSGLFRLSGGQWFHYQRQNGLRGSQVNNLTASSTGEIHVTYRDEGVIDRIHMDAGRIVIEKVDRTGGLAADHVYAVHSDRAGRLWALSDLGAAMRDGGAWMRFDQSDGLLWSDCNTFLQASDGAIWIGTERGLTHFPSPTPAAPSANPVVRFSEVRLGDHAVDPKSALVEPQSEPFTAKFTVLDLAHSSRVQYRYRCLGLDNRWIETSRPEVSLDYLRPGPYRLEVQARWAESPWSGAPASLTLEVRPRWFESRWFQVLVIALICGAAWLAWKSRARRFAAARAKLQAQVDERTSELRAANELLRNEITEREIAAREKQRLEEELLQAKKLESIGRLAGGVAHDFNNLLTVINGHCELVLERLHERDPLRVSILEVRAAGERAAELTRRLLAFSRKQMLQPKPLSLADTVRGIESMLRRLVRADIELLVDLQSDGGLVMADRGQIEQVLVNLVVNAADAISGAGRIAIAVRPVELSDGAPLPDPDLHPGPYVVITVADTGQGMDEQTLRNVFEPFFTTKEVGKGTGLGLAMVHGVVKQSVGSILAESRPGKGSTFRIYLPRLGAASPAAPADVPEVRPAKGHESILLVEDQEQVRELAVSVLNQAGYSVQSASDGASALVLLERRKSPVDLLVTDVVMPQMSGVELAERVCSRAPAARVLYISGYTTESPVPDYLSKPFTPAELLDKVRKTLDAFG